MSVAPVKPSTAPLIPRTRTFLKVFLASLPVWAVIFIATDVPVPFGEALHVSVRNAFIVAVLGSGVWWFTRRLPWPRRLSARFYAMHCLAACGFSLLWLIFGFLSIMVSYGIPFSDIYGQYLPWGWRFSAGVWIYGLIAGVSYAVQTRERLLEQERLNAEVRGQVTEARLDALRSQLNPHFLFNTLHSIHGLVGQNPAAAEDAIEELGALLRYALKERPEALVALREEWEFTRGYVDVERLRLEERLGFEADVDPAALDCKVPPLVLQPLVENAILHGVASRLEGGRVELTVRRRGDRVFLRVTNPFDEAPDGDDHHGLGLRALRTRLAAFYGDRAVLRVSEDRDGDGPLFVVEVELPVEGSSG